MTIRDRDDCAPPRAFSRRTALLALAGSWAFALGCKSKPAPGASPFPSSNQPVGPDNSLRPTLDDRCAMCGMRVADHPKFAGAIVLADGGTHYACSGRCTLATALHPDKHLGVTADQVSKVFVSDYYNPGRGLDASTAFLVVGSDVLGPMGPDILGASSQEAATTLTGRHGGRIVRRADVTDTLLAELKKAHAPK